MALGIYIAIGVAAIVVLIFVKLIKSTPKNSFIGAKSKCPRCGRRKETFECNYCKKSQDSQYGV